jgi:predicted Rossmann-fold nucleotide-binding protein
VLLLRLGIIGPTNLEETSRILKMPKEKYAEEVRKIARLVAEKEFEILIVPGYESKFEEGKHRLASQEIFATEYEKAFGKKVFGLVPVADKEWGSENLDKTLCDEIIETETWYQVPAMMAKNSDALLCIGFSAGVAMEIAYTKYFPVKKTIVCEWLVSKKMPEEATKYANAV